MSASERWIDVDPSASRDYPTTVTLWERAGTYGKTAVHSWNFSQDVRMVDLIDAVFRLREKAPGCRIECDTHGLGITIICELHRVFDL